MPLYSDALKIEIGMLYSEVTDLIGLPQKMRTSGIIVVEYELENEGSVLVEYIHNSEGQLVVQSVEFE